MTGPAARVTAALDGDVWRISLDAADAGNPVDQVMAGQLADALDRRPAEARTVLLLAAGRDFCVGADVPSLAAAEDLPALSEAWLRVLRTVLCSEVPADPGVRRRPESREALAALVARRRPDSRPAH